MKQKAYIVEDELNNRDLLIDLINENFSNSIEIIGSSDSVRETEVFIANNQVDLLFLDIEVSDGIIFELLNTIDYIKYKLIFITGYSQYAIKAIKYAAVDYLLKPIDTKEFVAAVNKVLIDRIQKNPVLEDLIRRKKFDIAEYILIYNGEINEKIFMVDIIYIESDGFGSKVYHRSNVTNSSKPIGIFEDILPEELFFRCHKSLIINRNYIKQVDKGRNLSLTLRNNVELQVSVRKKDEFLEWFKLY
jgi:two-component system LytT family response regulator